MKTGKFIELGNYKNVKIGYGTVDYKNLKTIYLKFNSWLSPMDDSEDYDYVILTSRKKIKNLIYNKKIPHFKKESIVDLDIKSNGIKSSKKSFMNLEITLFVNEYFDIKNKDVKNEIKDIIIEVVEECLIDKSLFNFHKTKI